AFDAEGFLSTLRCIVNVIAEYSTGRLIQQKGNSYETISKMMVAGALLLFVALSWNMVFPINKKIWTSSFVLYTVGLDLFVLAILIFVIDIKAHKKWTYFFEVFGKNTLFLYLLSEIGIILMENISIGEEDSRRWLYENVFHFTNDYVSSLLFAVSWMLFCWVVGYWMDKMKIYVKV
ncbi:MAG TPA: DUF5009 domain-containing protein, partial [Cytophagales bacterium]|nr:DUF5009 domain-containing protein [Cytophagales bacterium]